VGAVEEVEEIHLREQMEKTFYSAINIIHAVLPVFREQNSGHILNVVDPNASLGTPCLGPLAASMHALAAYTESLALGLSKYNIKATLIQVALEVSLLTNPLTFVENGYNSSDAEGLTRSRKSLSNDIKDLYTKLNVFPTKPFEDAVHGIVSVAGTKDPPSRLVCGEDTINELRQQLDLESEELDAFDSKFSRKKLDI
jgi:NAD(P)-dependent dehydrogenase (short-subunit alcohol dehydrogenase family)